MFFHSRQALWSLAAAAAILLSSDNVMAQAQEPAPHDHSQMQMDAAHTHNSAFMQEWVAYGMFNHQGGTRGSDEGRAPNWWMGMWRPALGGQPLTVTTMFSLDRATVGESGYAELFQVGETLDGQPLIDRQHPHDFFMQLSAAWRMPLGTSTALTIAGGPSGEPALGPGAYMHRASSNGNPITPLGHHALDSTHIAFGVVTAALDASRWTVEGSVFNGREPDENRWDFDFAPLDSVSGRLWFRPRPDWELQVSAGHLHEPEPLNPGDLVRITGSVSWLRSADNGMAAVTGGFGTNREDTEAHGNAFVEGSWSHRLNTLYGRFELQQADTAVLLGESGHDEADHDFSTVLALTMGGVRQLFGAKGLELGIGGDVTFYGVPAALSGSYGNPVSAHVFLRLGSPAGSRMWNMRMARPMSGY